MRIFRWWKIHEPRFVNKGPAGKALVDLAKRWIKYLLCILITNFPCHRYLTPPSTSTAVERLFSAAGLIMESKRNKLSPCLWTSFFSCAKLTCWASAIWPWSEEYAVLHWVWLEPTLNCIWIIPLHIVWRYIVMLISCVFQNIVEISLSHFF